MGFIPTLPKPFAKASLIVLPTPSPYLSGGNIQRPIQEAVRTEVDKRMDLLRRTPMSSNPRLEVHQLPTLTDPRRNTLSTAPPAHCSSITPLARPSGDYCQNPRTQPTKLELRNRPPNNRTPTCAPAPPRITPRDHTVPYLVHRIDPPARNVSSQTEPTGWPHEEEHTYEHEDADEPRGGHVAKTPEQCLSGSYNFESMLRLRAIPPFPQEKWGTSTQKEREIRTKRQNARAKREKQPASA